MTIMSQFWRRLNQLRHDWEDGSPLFNYGTVVVAFAACGFIFVSSLGDVRDKNGEIGQSQEVLRTLDRLRTLVATAESSLRGFLLTEDAIALGPYHLAASGIDSVLERLVGPPENRELSEIESAGLRENTLDYTAALARISSLANAGQRDGAMREFRGIPLRRLSERFQGEADQLQQRETRKLEARRRAAEDAYRLSLIWGVIAGGLGLTLVLSSMIVLSRELRWRYEAEDDLRRHLAQLQMLSETNVRLAQIPSLKDLIQTAAQELRQLVPCEMVLLEIQQPIADVTWSESVPAPRPLINVLRQLGQREGPEARRLSTDQLVDHLRNLQIDPGWFLSRQWNYLHLPVLDSRRNCIGFLDLYGRLQGSFTAQDQLVAGQFVYALGSSLQNARLVEELQAADRRKDEFLAMLGHELRNPLAAIVTGTQVLTSPTRPRASARTEHDNWEILKVVSRQASHMARLVDELLDVSRIIQGKVILRQETLDLRPLLKNLIADFELAYRPARVIELCDETTEPALTIHGDAARLSQCFTNLLTNAAKFSSPDSVIRMEVRQLPAEGTVEIAVVDQGVGLEQSELRRIFDAFHQVAPSVDRSQGGLGLGLALARGIVVMHGGKILAESAGPGHGCRFSIQLPLVKEMASAPQASDRCESSGSLRILLIDDRRDSLLPLHVLLTRQGHQVQDAFNARDGLEVAARFRPDVILCDIGLPGGMTGYDVARALRNDEQLRKTYLVAVSGYGQPQDRHQAAEAGFDYHLTKPVGRDDLVDLLDHRPRFEVSHRAANLLTEREGVPVEYAADH